MDSLATLKEWQEQTDLPRTPLILVTSDDTDAAKEYVQYCGAKKAVSLGGTEQMSDASVDIIEGDIDGIFETPTGKRYHFDAECGGENSKEITITQAKTKGLTPCEKCAW